MENVKKILNKEVANFAVLYTKLHNYHWFVKGNLFYTLHAKFEELYDAVTGYYDNTAERLLMVGGCPTATMKECLSLATIQKATGKEAAEEMVRYILKDFETVVTELNEGIKASNDAGDDVTADLLVGISKDLQKQAWMLRTVIA